MHTIFYHFLINILQILFIVSKHDVQSFSIHHVTNFHPNQSILTFPVKRIPSSVRLSSKLRLFLSESEHENSSNENKKDDAKRRDESDERSTSSISTMSSNTESPKEIVKNKLEKAKTPTKKRRKRMELAWCGKESCTYFDDNKREKVLGDNNEIKFENPATGQVVYQWQPHVDGDRGEDNDKMLSTVLISIRKNDDELLKLGAEAVRELTSKGDVVVMLIPDIAAKLKHYFGVDNDKIQLFEPTNQFSLDTHRDTKNNIAPDLVCTLGGDGSLMYASQLFQGPCPPVLCVAGGSLGFLTPFSKEEMVDAIRISLGLNVDLYDDLSYSNGQGESSNWCDDYQDTPKMPPFMASKQKTYVDEEGIAWTGSYRVPREEVKRPSEVCKRFGYNNQICMSLRMRLQCLIISSEGVVRANFNVLNEVVIDRGSSPYLAALECFCDDVHLTTVQADGVIFSTPTGSTAYSMAAGGSVVHPAVPAILVTPICPHVLSFRSMVFPDHVVLRCYIPEDARADASVAFDGKHRRDLHRGDSVQIEMSPYPVPTINRVDHSSDWLTSLKRSFNFNTRTRQMPLK